MGSPRRCPFLPWPLAILYPTSNSPAAIRVGRKGFNPTKAKTKSWKLSKRERTPLIMGTHGAALKPSNSKYDQRSLLGSLQNRLAECQQMEQRMGQNESDKLSALPRTYLRGTIASDHTCVPINCSIDQSINQLFLGHFTCRYR